MSEKKPVANPIPTPLDVTGSAKGVWLVKVPNYLAKKWLAAPDNIEVGRIRITKSKVDSKVKQDVVFKLNESLASSGSSMATSLDETVEPVPLEHKFVMASSGDQTIYILKQSEENSKEALSVTGKVMQRAECTPMIDNTYLDLKRKAKEKSMQPKKTIIQLDEVVVSKFLPKLQQIGDKDKEKKKMRKDKEEVQNILFNAFSKHQFYPIKDLERITQQPISYLKEILHEICRLNVKGVHKNTWELKPEYRHHKEDTK